MSSSSWARTGLLSPLLLLAGCRVGPNYKTPAVPPPPAAYSENGINGPGSLALSGDASLRQAWWEVYGDPRLNQLEQECAASNQEIAAAFHTYEQAHDMVRESRANLYPTVAVGAAVARDRVSANRPLLSPSGHQNYWDFLVPLSISWEPDLWGRIRRDIESHTADAQASAAQLADVRLSLQGFLAVTYLQIRGIDLQAELLHSTLATYERSLALTQTRMDRGLDSEGAVQEAKAQLEETRSELLDLGVARAQHEHGIAVLVGVPATGFTIADQPLMGDPPAIPTGIPSELLKRRPDVSAAERRVAAANGLIGEAKATYYPSIILGAGAGLESDQISKLFLGPSAGWGAGLTVNEVLFDAGRRKAQVDYAVAAREQATALYREQVLSAFRDVEDQLSTLRVLEREANAQDAAVTASRRSTELSTLRYERGLVSYLEVLTNQTIELTNERIASALVVRRMVASVQLQISLGGNWTTTRLPSD